MKLKRILQLLAAVALIVAVAFVYLKFTLTGRRVWIGWTHARPDDLIVYTMFCLGLPALFWRQSALVCRRLRVPQSRKHAFRTTLLTLISVEQWLMFLGVRELAHLAARPPFTTKVSDSVMIVATLCCHFVLLAALEMVTVVALGRMPWLASASLARPTAMACSHATLRAHCTIYPFIVFLWVMQQQI